LRRTDELTRISERQSKLLKASSFRNKASLAGIIIGIPVAFLLGAVLVN
jgi:hypothetical protein